jgi:hypothetical protein
MLYLLNGYEIPKFALQETFRVFQQLGYFGVILFGL